MVSNPMGLVATWQKIIRSIKSSSMTKIKGEANDLDIMREMKKIMNG